MNNKLDKNILIFFILCSVLIIMAIIAGIYSCGRYENTYYKIENINGDIFNNCKEYTISSYICGDKQIFRESIIYVKEIKNE